MSAELLNVEETAEYLRVTPRTLRNWREKGDVNLPYVKLGRRVVYRRTDLNELVQSLLVVDADDW